MCAEHAEIFLVSSAHLTACTRGIAYPITDSSVAGFTASHRSAVVLQCAHEDARYDKQVDGSGIKHEGALLAIPMMGVSRLECASAVLQLSFPRNGITPERRVEASVAARCVQLLLTNHEKHCHGVTATALLDALRALPRGATVAEISAELMGHAREMLASGSAAFYLVDRNTGNLWDLALDDHDDDAVQHVKPHGVGIVGHIAATGNLVCTMRARSHPSYHPEVDCCYDESGRRHHVDDLLGVPLLDAEGAATGVLVVGNRQRGGYTAADERTIRSIASVAGVALVRHMAEV